VTEHTAPPHQLPLVVAGLLRYAPAVPKVLSFPAARVGAAVVTGIGFFIMVAFFVAPVTYGFGTGRINANQARWLFLVVLGTIPTFGAVTAATSMLDAYAQGKFRLPPSAEGQRGSGRSQNPWWLGLLAGLFIGLPVVLASFFYISATWPAAGLTPLDVTLLLASVSGVLTGVVLFVCTGGVVLREIAVPRPARLFQGSLQAYLWQRHVLPQFVINAWFNAWAGLSIVKGPVSDPASSIGRSDVLLEASITGLFLVLGLASGTRAYVDFDLRWGVMQRVPDRAPGPLRIAGLLFGCACGAWLMLCLVLFGLGIERIHTWPLVAARGVLYGTYSAAIAYWSARWSLMTRAPAHAPVVTETATD
jgi:hypothetical protein